MSRSSDRPLPTSKDVAALAGVSQSTVSYVLSGKRPISAETRQRVEAAIERLTYEPNAGARALRGRRTNVIALVARLSESTDVADTIPYIDTVVAQARGRDFDVVLVTAGQGPGELVRLAKRSICDGVVLMDIRGRDDRLATAAALGLPVVLIGTPDDDHGLPSADVDSRRAGELLAAELTDTGHRDVVLVGETPEVRAAGFRFVTDFHAGVADVAERRGLRLRVLHPPRPGWTGLAETADDLFGALPGRPGTHQTARTGRPDDQLDERPADRHSDQLADQPRGQPDDRTGDWPSDRPSDRFDGRLGVRPGDRPGEPFGERLGVIARTPQVIGWVLQLAALRGLVPGRDLSLVGQCTDEAALGFGVPVTNVSPEPRETARLAMSILFEALDGGPAAGGARRVARPGGLTRRASTVVFPEG